MVKNFFEKTADKSDSLKIINLYIETKILPDNLFQPMSSDLGLKVPTYNLSGWIKWRRPINFVKANSMEPKDLSSRISILCTSISRDGFLNLIYRTWAVGIANKESFWWSK